MKENKCSRKVIFKVHILGCGRLLESKNSHVQLENGHH